MRQITRDSINAFLNRQIFTRQNMKVREYKNKYYLKLHNNIIAVIHKDNTLLITNCGWFTPTTKERLNALPNVNIYQKAFKWYLNGVEWNGQKTNVSKWNECIKNGYRKLKKHKKNPLLYSFLNNNKTIK